jgi:hypothetical protein
MLEEIIVTTDDRPGLLAEMGELLGHHGVNIETLAASSHDDRSVIHLVVDDGDETAEILASHGFKVEGSRPVLTVSLDDRPGELGRYCRRLSKSGVSISSVYLVNRNGGETELIFAVDNLEAATRA